MMISCHGARQWKRLCAAVGRPEWETDPRMATNSDRVENHDYVIETIAATTRTRGVAEWMEVFEAEGVNAGPIQTFADLAADAQVEALGLLRRQAAGAYPEFGFVAAPLTFDGATEADELPPPPRLGEHNEALAAELADG
jgi:crotonobetainyl-CoA:carnitine CoA-transferase CaiB-like acyl-CoA transferase